MDKAFGEKMPQFYFVFREKELIGYMFLIGNDKMFRAFPWLAIDNLDELPMKIVEPLMDIAIKAQNNEGGNIINADGSIEEFDGMSLIEWTSDNKIKLLKEFGCNLNNYNPYQHGDVPQFRKGQANWF